VEVAEGSRSVKWMAGWEDADNVPLFRLGLGRRGCPAKPDCWWQGLFSPAMDTRHSTCDIRSVIGVSREQTSFPSAPLPLNIISTIAFPRSVGQGTKLANGVMYFPGTQQITDRPSLLSSQPTDSMAISSTKLSPMPKATSFW
jgi:hypothetical protein